MQNWLCTDRYTSEQIHDAHDVDMHNSTDRHISEQELYCVIDKHGMVQSAVFQWLHLHKIV